MSEYLNSGSRRYIKPGYNEIDERFVNECDAAFDVLLSCKVKELCAKSGTRVIGLTGPTCSGKTTAAKKLISCVGDSQRVVHVISLDDFYKELFSRASLENADVSQIDFDSPDTLDAELLDGFLCRLFQSGRATKPIFDFKTGERSTYEEICIDDNDVVIIEGIQLLYPSVLSIIGHMASAIMCVRPCSAIDVDGRLFEPDFIRLCRRIVRDYNFRGSDPNFTFAVWDGVRKNEDVNIFPHLDRCDIIVDTTLAYELNILAPYLRRILSAVTPTDTGFEKSRQLLRAFDGIVGIDGGVVGKNSLYKEFV